MPELPEVETTCRGIMPHIQNQIVHELEIRNQQLRWPIPVEIKQIIGQKILSVHRRAKYILLDFDIGTTIIHLGMSGSLRISELATKPNKHDHVDLILKNGFYLRYTDPRRFGCWLFTNDAIAEHPLIRSLGPEPLSEIFTAKYLLAKINKSNRCIKDIIMDSHIVVGVGNIYAAEALFLSGLHPLLKGQQLTLKDCARLVKAIKKILIYAIQRGGTTIRDFLTSDGKPGYFKQELNVYGRQQQLCKQCQAILQLIRLQNRSTVFCPVCQGLK